MKYVFKYKTEDTNIIIDITDDNLTILDITVRPGNINIYKVNETSFTFSNGIAISQGSIPLVATWNKGEIRIWINSSKSNNNTDIINKKIPLSIIQVKNLLYFFNPCINIKKLEVL